MIPWLINSMLCRLFFNTDLLHVFRRVPVANLKITVRSYSHKVYLQTSLFLPLLHAIFLLRMVTLAQIKYRANNKPKTTKYLPAIVVYPYLFIDLLLFSLSPSFHFAAPSFHLVPITV